MPSERMVDVTLNGFDILLIDDRSDVRGLYTVPDTR